MLASEISITGRVRRNSWSGAGYPSEDCLLPSSICGDEPSDKCVQHRDGGALVRRARTLELAVRAQRKELEVLRAELARTRLHLERALANNEAARSTPRNANGVPAEEGKESKDRVRAARGARAREPPAAHIIARK
jgi:hypothetical protein